MFTPSHSSIIISQQIRKQLAEHESNAHDPLQQFASDVARRMGDEWANAQRTSAEELLARHPELNSHPNAALRIIYEEICLRIESGEEIDLASLRRRFPNYVGEIEVLLAGHDLMESMAGAPQWPEMGESLGEFTLVSEIGKGAGGRVYLARDTELAGRMVVIKATPRTGGEHLNLARLQHTFIVPLFSVRDYPTSHLRLLCMPYLGGSSIDRINHQLRDLPSRERTGLSLLAALNSFTSPEDQEGIRETPSLRFFRRASFADAICWIGACLAEALQYAHDQGFVHFDIKPSNILLTKDAQPMLLDFHLARYPISPGNEVNDFGGTAAYMSPEQKRAFESIRATGKSGVAVGPSSDIYSLGLTLAECLTAIEFTSEGDKGDFRWHRNNQLSPGLRDILHRAVSVEPAKRYRTAGEFADDLRRHISQLPLKGVRNRSLRERWNKWRRRRPQGGAVASLAAILLLGCIAMGAFYWNQQGQQVDQARTLLDSSRQLAEKGDFKSALESLRKAGAIASRTFRGGTIRNEIEREGVRVLRISKEQDLDAFVDKIQYLYSDPYLTPDQSKELALLCERGWTNFLDGRDFERIPPSTKTALLDLALLWSDFSAKSSSDQQSSKELGLGILNRVEKITGAQPSLTSARQHFLSGQLPSDDSTNSVSGSEWERIIRGRWLFTAGQYEAAIKEFEAASRQRPNEFWPWFYLGMCHEHLNHAAESAQSFTVAIALRPESAVCYFHRGNAWVALNRFQDARFDFDRSVSLEPKLAVAFLNRGVLSLKEGRFSEARRDISASKELGANPARVFFHLALVDLGEGNAPSARANAQQAAKLSPDWKEPIDLLKRLDAAR